MKLWGGRFEGGPSEIFERFSGSLHFDRRLIDAGLPRQQNPIDRHADAQADNDNIFKLQ